MNRFRHLLERHPARDHHHPFSNQRVGMIGEEVDSDDAVGSLVHHHLQHAVGLVGNHRLGIDTHGHLHLHRIDPLGLGLIHRETDEGRLGASEDDAAVQILVVLRILSQQIGSGHPPLLARGVGQHQPTDHITDGKDVRDAGTATGIGLDDTVLHGHPGRFELQRLQYRPLAGGHQHPLAAVLVRLPFGVLVADGHGAGLPLDPGHLDRGMQGEVGVVVEHRRELPGDLRLHLGQHPILPFQQGDLGAEVLEDLRHLHTDGTTTDHRHPLRHAVQTPDGIGGEHAPLFETFPGTRDGRHEGRGTGGDDGGTEGDVLSPGAVTRHGPLMGILAVA